MAKWLQSVFPEIIHPSHAGFVSGRYMTENIVKLPEAMNECEKNNKDSVVISFDFRKVFDTVNWSTLFEAFKHFGFRDRCIEMIKPILAGPSFTILNNGHWLEMTPIFQGCCQGCCFSPGAFTVLVELLGLGIRWNHDIKGVKISQVEVVAGQFADDLWSNLEATSENINSMLNEIEHFCSYSGLSLNFDKCAILKVGPFCNSEA